MFPLFVLNRTSDRNAAAMMKEKWKTALDTCLADILITVLLRIWPTIAPAPIIVRLPGIILWADGNVPFRLLLPAMPIASVAFPFSPKKKLLYLHRTV